MLLKSPCKVKKHPPHVRECMQMKQRAREFLKRQLHIKRQSRAHVPTKIFTSLGQDMSMPHRGLALQCKNSLCRRDNIAAHCGCWGVFLNTELPWHCAFHKTATYNTTCAHFFRQKNSAHFELVLSNPHKKRCLFLQTRNSAKTVGLAHNQLRICAIA